MSIGHVQYLSMTRWSKNMGGYSCHSHLKRTVLEFDGTNQHIEEKHWIRIVVVRLLFKATMQVLAFDSEQECLVHICCFTISLPKRFLPDFATNWRLDCVERGGSWIHTRPLLYVARLEDQRGVDQGNIHVEHKSISDTRTRRHRQTTMQNRSFRFNFPNRVCCTVILFCWIVEFSRNKLADRVQCKKAPPSP